MHNSLLSITDIMTQYGLSKHVINTWTYNSVLTAVGRQSNMRFYARNQVENALEQRKRGIPADEMTTVKPKFFLDPALQPIKSCKNRKPSVAELQAVPEPVEEARGLDPKLLVNFNELQELIKRIDEAAVALQKEEDEAGMNKNRASANMKALTKLAIGLENVIVALFGEEHRP